jgi:hypothetical protein
MILIGFSVPYSYMYRKYINHLKYVYCLVIYTHIIYLCT